MAQLGEDISIGMIQTEKHNEDTCPFCAKSESESKVNDLGNNADKLRNACKNGDNLGFAEPKGGQWCIVYKHPKTGVEEISEIRSNPHHCIPGKASLKGEYEHPILEAIEKDKDTITGDIGYNVNGQPNGIWLPTIIEHFYAGYKNVEPVAGISWGKLTKDYPEEQFSCAEAAMYETNRQFHDAHQNYNEHMKGRLDKLFDKVKLRKEQCPEAGPKAKPNVPPPFGLVSWMNALSKGMASWLNCPPIRWRSPIYTSRHAEDFHEKIKLKTDKKI